jgi:pimeloyl-ACP methyl ester carboxylesterase
MHYNIKTSNWFEICGEYIQKSEEKLIIFFHGFTTDKSSEWRFNEIESIINLNTDWSIFRFDFLGCGESWKWVVSFQSELNDAQEVITYFLRKWFKNIVIYGHSMGWTIALLVYPLFIEYIRALVLSGPATGPMFYNWEEYVWSDLYLQWPIQGYIDFPSKIWRKIQVSYDIIEDFCTIYPEGIRESLKCPVTIIHGNHPEDTEESELLEHSKKLLSHYNEWELVILDGAKHTMFGYSKDIGNIIVRMLTKIDSFSL